MMATPLVSQTSSATCFEMRWKMCSVSENGSERRYEIWCAFEWA